MNEQEANALVEEVREAGYVAWVRKEWTGYTVNFHRPNRISQFFHVWDRPSWVAHQKREAARREANKSSLFPD